MFVATASIVSIAFAVSILTMRDANEANLAATESTLRPVGVLGQAVMGESGAVEKADLKQTAERAAALGQAAPVQAERQVGDSASSRRRTNRVTLVNGDDVARSGEPQAEAPPPVESLDAALDLVQAIRGRGDRALTELVVKRIDFGDRFDAANASRAHQCGPGEPTDECLFGLASWRQWAHSKGGQGYVAWIEDHADYDGDTCVRWGSERRVASAEECALACWNFVPHMHRLAYCNTFVYCPKAKCWAEDIHQHTQGECWLKYSETPDQPLVNSRGAMIERRRVHRTMPELPDWIAGTILPPSVRPQAGVLKIT